MRLLKIAGILVVSVTLIGFAGRAEAAMPKLQLQAVTPLGYSGEVLRLRVVLPCGTHFYGLVAAGDAEGKLLQLAAAVTEAPIVCTSMPETVEVGVDYLATHNFRKIAPMTIYPSDRLVTVAVDELRLTAAGSQPALYAVYASRCGQDQGMLVHRHGKERLELAFVESSDGHRKLASCSAAPKSRRVTALALKAGYNLRPLPDHAKSLAKSYILRLAPVRSAKTGAVGTGLNVVYQRGCNEAPIGVVLGRGSSAVKVSVLVARYSNLRCPAELPASQWETLNEPALTLTQSLPIAMLPASDPSSDAGLHLRAPTDLVLEGATNGLKSLHVKFIAGCGDTAMVYSHDNSGILAVGVLTLAPQGQGKDSGDSGDSARCRTAPVIRTVAQPFIAATVMADHVYPLRLKGS